MNIYKSSDDVWFLLVVSRDKIPAVVEGIGRTDLLRDPRFTDPAKLATNMGQLTAILDEIFSTQPMAHWRQVFDKAHITYGLVQDPHDVIKDPQLSENGIIVPFAGAGGKLKSTISSPIVRAEVFHSTNSYKLKSYQRESKKIMKKFEGKVAVITGGNSGIGLATAQRFVEEGAYVFITGRRQIRP